MSTTAWVYFLQADSDERLIKIGWTTDLERRLASLSLSSPTPLILLGSFGFRGEAPAMKFERGLHRHLATDRAHGEWFRPSREVVRWATVAGIVDGHTRFELPEDRVMGEVRQARREGILS